MHQSLTLTSSSPLALELASSPFWAVLPDWLAAFTSQDTGTTIKTGAPSESLTQVGSGNASQVSVIPIMGAISNRPAWWAGTSATQVSQSLASALSNPQVGAIVLYVDSPGGVVTGVPELAQQIAEANAVKPVYAYTDGMNASAAYWLSSQAGSLWASPSSTVGSVGVYVMHMDLSKALDEAGYKPTFIKAGEYKAEGNAFEPLSDDAKSYLQTHVDAIYKDFVAGVALGRRTTADKVKKSYGQGRVMRAQDAQAVGMIDKVGSFAQMIASIKPSQTNGFARRKAQAQVQVELARLIYC